MTFREFITESKNEDYEKLVKSISTDITSVPAIGTTGYFAGVLVITTKTLADAKNYNIRSLILKLNKIFKEFNIILDKYSEYDLTDSTGTFIQSKDWRKDGPNDQHELYIAFRDKK